MFKKILKIVQHRKITYIISAAIIVAGIANIALRGGLNMGIDFAGGNMMQVWMKDEVTIGEVRDVLIGTGYGNNVQKIADPDKNLYILKTAALERDNDRVIQQIIDALEEEFGNGRVVIEKVDIVGPRISSYLLRTSFLSCISFFGKEMDTFILAALLTIIGYSLNDTIVVFDRARENLRSARAFEEYENTVNLSINQSLSRTLITSITTLLVVISLYVFGGNIIRNFAFALIVGILAGTYSSMFVASAILVDWHRLKPEKLKKV
jgi:preprotein translocase subunit SecF